MLRVPGFVASLSRGAEPASPSLVVVMGIDRFRADPVDRRFLPSTTKTGPGHAVMPTGVRANSAGRIIDPDRIDGGTFERGSCVGDPG